MNFLLDNKKCKILHEQSHFKTKMKLSLNNLIPQPLLFSKMITNFCYD